MFFVDLPSRDVGTGPRSPKEPLAIYPNSPSPRPRRSYSRILWRASRSKHKTPRCQRSSERQHNPSSSLQLYPAWYVQPLSPNISSRPSPAPSFSGLVLRVVEMSIKPELNTKLVPPHARSQLGFDLDTFEPIPPDQLRVTLDWQEYDSIHSHNLTCLSSWPI